MMTRDQPNSQRSSKLVVGNQTSGHSQNHHHTNHHKIVQFEPFCLHSEDDRSLKQALELIESASLNRFKVCVVSIISKDSLGESMKNHLVQSLLNNNNNNSKRRQRNKNNHQRGIPQTSKTTSDEAQDTTIKTTTTTTTDHPQQLTSNDDYENQVIGQVDSKSGIIVLNLTSFLEADKLYSLSETVDRYLDSNQIETHQRPFVSNLWPKWNQNLIKTMLILLIMSHIVVFYNPEPSIDYNLIQTFKVLETLRLKSQTRITDLLETIASKQMFPQQWIRQGRVSCPRALFVCDTSYLDIPINPSDIVGIKRDLEDQIYKLLKKSNITSRPLGSNYQGQQQQITTLLSLPERDDFVFIITRNELSSLGTGRCNELIAKEDAQQHDVFYSKLFKSLGLCHDTTSEGDKSENLQKQPAPANHQEDSLSQEEDSQVEMSAVPASNIGKSSNSNTSIGYQSRFKKFINKHISDIQAAAQVDQDNKHHPGKLNMNLLVPRYDDFFTVLLRLKNLFFPTYSFERENSDLSPSNLPTTNWLMPDERRFVDIYDLVNNDELFSKRHCYKTRLAALEFYTRGLQVPPLNKATHESSLDSARRLYLNHARGLACSSNLDLLVEQCNLYWQNLGHSKLSADDGIKDGRQFKGGNRVLRTVSSDNAPSSNDNSAISGPTSAQLINNQRSKCNLTITRRANGIKMTTSCDCGRQTNFLVTPVDRKKKLERVDIHRLND